MHPFINKILVGAAMLAGTIAVCVFMRDDPPSGGVIVHEVKGKLSVSSVSGRVETVSGKTAVGGERPDTAIPKTSDEQRSKAVPPPNSAADADFPEKTRSSKEEGASLLKKGGEEKKIMPPRPFSEEVKLSGSAPGALSEMERKGDSERLTPPAVESASAKTEKKTASSKRMSAAPEKAKVSHERSVTSSSFSMSGNTIRLTLRGNAPMVGHYFSLKDPDRIVLDIAGDWDVSIPPVPSNRLIRSVRTGRHEDKTRLVFDMKVKSNAALVPLDRNSLELSIK